MQFTFGILSRARKRGLLRRRGPQAEVQAKAASTAEDPHTYALQVRRDEVALGRFVKRLSVLGAERIQVERARDDVIHVRMKRPPAVTNWEATVARLVDRCGLQRLGA